MKTLELESTLSERTFLVLDNFPGSVEYFFLVEKLLTIGDGILARLKQFRLFLLAFFTPLMTRKRGTTGEGRGTDEWARVNR